MRMASASTATLLLCLALLAGCQSAAPSAEQAARREKIEQADLHNAQTFCAMIDEANQTTIARRQLVPDNEDCAYFRRNGTLVGYSPEERNQYTGFFDNLRDISAYSRAQKAKLPASVSGSREASEIYRKLLVRGFDEETAGTVSRSKAFAAAVSAFRQARQARGAK